MEFLYGDEPIVACSSGNTSNCAIAVIRFSGFSDPEVFKPFLKLKTKNLKPRHAYYCDLHDQGELIDQVVATFFKGPSSYNGENILELAVHGNVINVERIISLFTERGGFRRAHPGEFSYRALKNKKLNLSQVEGLDLLLNASSDFALKQGFSLMNGRLQESYINLHKSFLNHKSSVEFSMDFLEDMGEEQADRQFKETFSQFKSQLDVLHHRVTGDSSRLINPEIVLVGQPNSGKSTLFNQLVREERSIVTEMAGTTRDYVSENINIGDVHYRLIDTAGLRQSRDLIEMEGVRRSVSLAERAFFKVFLINPFEFDLRYTEFVKSLSFDLIIFTHADREGFEKVLSKLLANKAFADFIKCNSFSGSIGAEKTGPMGAEKTGPMGAEKTGPMGAEKTGPMGAEKTGPIGAGKTGSIGAGETLKYNDFSYLTSLSCLNNQLLAKINETVNKKYLSQISSEPILLQRHKQKILEAKSLLAEYSQLIEIESDISIISSELNGIGHCISELIGIISPDDVLHNIFDNFCIGK